MQCGVTLGQQLAHHAQLAREHLGLGGVAAMLGIGLALSFGYILLQTVSATFAVNANTPPMLAAWIPNLLFAVVAYFCYRSAPN